MNAVNGTKSKSVSVVWCEKNAIVLRILARSVKVACSDAGRKPSASPNRCGRINAGAIRRSLVSQSGAMTSVYKLTKRKEAIAL